MMKHLLRSAVIAMIVLFSLAVVVLTYLAYPGTPSKSRVMTFEGFIELPRLGRLAITDYLTLKDHALFATNESAGTVFKADIGLNPQIASKSIIQSPGGGAIHGVALVPEQNIAFVTRSGDNTVGVFNPITLESLGSIHVADDPDPILYDSLHHLVYVANGESKLATLIDPQKRAIVATIPLPGTLEDPALDAHTGMIFQNLEDISAVAAVDVERRSIVGQWSLAPCKGPSGLASDSEHRRLFAVCKLDAMLVVFDMDTHRVVKSLKIGGGPGTVAFDPVLHRIYVSGITGTLTIIQQDSADDYQVLDKIRTHFGANTLTVDPVSHKVFVAYAGFLTRPRIAVFSPTL